MAAVLELHLTGGAANSDPDASLGGVASGNQLSATALNNLFDNVDPDERTAGDIEYRAIDIKNTGDVTASGVEMYMSTETSNAGTVLDFGLDSGTQTIVDEDTAPNAPTITFGHYTSSSTLSVSDIAASATQRVWIRRTVSAGAVNDAEDLGAIAVVYA